MKMKKKEIHKRVEEEILASYESLYRLAFSYVRNEQDALDIVQESVYKAIKNADKINEEQYVKTWIWRIVINTALDYKRKIQEEVSLDHVEELSKEDNYRDLDTIKALEILNERERTIVVLHYFEGWNLEQVAQSLEENVNTIKSAMYRSLKKLKVEIMKGDMLEWERTN